MFLPATFREIGGKCAEVAVIGGKGSVKLGHQAADVVGFVHQDDIPLSFCQVQRRADTAKASANDKHLTAGWN